MRSIKVHPSRTLNLTNNIHQMMAILNQMRRENPTITFKEMTRKYNELTGGYLYTSFGQTRKLNYSQSYIRRAYYGFHFNGGGDRPWKDSSIHDPVMLIGARVEI